MTLKFLAALFFPLIATAQEPLHVMSFNIRLNTPADSANAWPYRKEFVADQVLKNNVHLLGVQEALHEQMTDLASLLPGYKYVGKGRDDGGEKGEYSAIFYDTARIEVINSATFWLSETPEVPGSKSWDAAITRVATWAEVMDKITGEKSFVFNTHFDHIGKEARRQSALLLLKVMEVVAGDYDIILTGDFNATPNEPPIVALTDKDKPYYLVNTASKRRKKLVGPAGTFNGWKTDSLPKEPIDFIFYRGNFKVKKHVTILETRDGRYSSDHFPVLVHLKQK